MNWELSLTKKADLIYAPSKRESAVPGPSTTAVEDLKGGLEKNLAT